MSSMGSNTLMIKKCIRNSFCQGLVKYEEPFYNAIAIEYLVEKNHERQTSILMNLMLQLTFNIYKKQTAPLFEYAGLLGYKIMLSSH